MAPPSVRVQPDELSDDRFSRFRLLQWWEQDRIQQAKVAVIGAGALGNEILKNLALTGFARVVVVDLDNIEVSNLARSVLYRYEDIGRRKVDAAASTYSQIYPEASVVPLHANVMFDVGLGLFHWADVIIAGLDNREARLWINQCAWRMNRPWVDGAIEGISGLARVFLPGEPPCYECTLGEEDWRAVNRRMSCNLLTREEMASGKVPTTPTTASVIAGIEVQEALKLIHELPVLQSKAFVFDGMGHTSYVVEYTSNPDCLAHHVCGEVIEVHRRSCDITLHELWLHANATMQSTAVTLDFSRQIVHRLECPVCGESEEVFAPVGSVNADTARCPHDGNVRVVHAIHSYTGSESYGNRTLDRLGLPLWDVFTGRTENAELAFLISADATDVVGPLAEEPSGARA